MPDLLMCNYDGSRLLKRKRKKEREKGRKTERKKKTSAVEAEAAAGGKKSRDTHSKRIFFFLILQQTDLSGRDRIGLQNLSHRTNGVLTCEIVDVFGHLVTRSTLIRVLGMYTLLMSLSTGYSCN